MCEESFLSLVREELVCLSQIESNVKPSSYDCLVIQTYVDCLLESEYKTCKEAVKVIPNILAGTNFLLSEMHPGHSTSTVKLTEWPLEQCDKHGHCKCRLDGFYYDVELKKCIDVDECSSFEPGCSQKCVNHPGTYECTCDPTFFHLSTDKKTCTRNDKDPMWLFFAHGQSIWNISLSGGSFELQKAGLQKTAVLDVDVLERRIYYADVGSNSIERLNLVGTGTYPETLQKYDVDGIEGIAVDWIGRNLYSVRRTDVLVQTLDGRYRRTLYQGVMRLPRAIAAHPQKGAFVPHHRHLRSRVLQISQQRCGCISASLIFYMIVGILAFLSTALIEVDGSQVAIVAICLFVVASLSRQCVLCQSVPHLLAGSMANNILKSQLVNNIIVILEHLKNIR
ncbi:unnamed protein product [Angiostrongylus costaricensis]|uniref:EGF_CA domain-containing protein n=1 Tax=Angiostrongylus costaricensis TaxID=334426 RepID=A0A0R3PKW6_ANGCS|nr:unnamed protein product [Angiostrongylus costaricensis]